MKKIIFVLSFIISLLMALSVFGETRNLQQTTEINFPDADRVEGIVERGSGEHVIIPTKNHGAMLIIPRLHFIPELIKSVENI